jgi:hypothetical protein
LPIAEIKIRAERKAGSLISEMEKAKGGQPYQKSTGNAVLPVEPTLKEMGIEPMQSHRWQLEALLPENPKKNTQASIAARLGVAQNTVSAWFGSNIKDDNTSVPDARVKIPPKERLLLAQTAKYGFLAGSALKKRTRIAREAKSHSRPYP